MSALKSKVSILLTLILSSSAVAYDEDYDRLFPHYIEYSTGTQEKPIGEAAGGKGGHAVVFIKGLCKDYTVNFPRVKVCDPSEKVPFPHDGVGINVDANYRNANWIPVPGYDFFMNGGLPAGATVTKEEYNRVIEKAYEMRIYEGVNFKRRIATKRLSPHDYVTAMGSESVGTDFALTFARSMSSHRVPVHESVLQEIADMLNTVNAPYLSGSKPYVWDMLSNNCAHLSAKIFATAGIRNPIKQDLPKYEQIFHLANPANGLLTVQDKTNFRDIDALKIWKSDEGLRESILKKGHLPIGAGSVTEFKSVFMKNEVFHTDLGRLLLPPKPLHRSLCIYHNFLRSQKEAEYSDLERNLGFWQKKYKEALKGIDPVSCKGDANCVDFMEKYSAILKKEIEETDRKLRILTKVVSDARVH